MNRDLQPELIVPDWPAPAGVVARSSTRLGGVSEGAFASLNTGLHVDDEPVHVNENRHRLRSLLDDVQMCWVNQVHGSEVVMAEDAVSHVPADALVTRRTGLACCISTADCLPVLMTDLKGSVVAAAHGGWRGLAAGVLENTVAAMATDPGNCIAWLGPAIGPCHFEVGAEVREAFLAGKGKAAVTRLEACFRPLAHDNKYMADLYALARCFLESIGLAHISAYDGCTYCDAGRFFSYRREPRTGRMVSLIYRKD